ncbi:MAG: hypothetical protein C0392_10335 [Syntrophus sp. (in: bacteria)]|nr:hypothetical protein [Syntrophus sp. (in: bacteria)]
MIISEIIRKGLDFYHIQYDDRILEDLTGYLRELIKWNGRVNLTGLKGAGPIVTELLFDAFFLYGHVKGSIIDLGSGSGIVGIPLKILDRSMEVYSVDRSLRKIQFQRHIKRSLSLEGFFPVHGRIEDIEPVGADCLVVKAFGTITEILEKGRDHIKEGGRAFILKGPKEDVAEVAGFDLEGVIPYTLPGGDKRYRLIMYARF